MRRRGKHNHDTEMQHLHPIFKKKKNILKTKQTHKQKKRETNLREFVDILEDDRTEHVQKDAAMFRKVDEHKPNGTQRLRPF